MARRVSDVQLVIRARNEAQRTLDQVRGATDRLTGSQDELTRSADRTGDELARLERGLAQLEKYNAAIAGSLETANAAMTRQAQTLHSTNAQIVERKTRVAELTRALNLLQRESETAFVGPRRNGLDTQIKAVQSQLKQASSELGRLSGTFDRELAGLQSSRQAFAAIRSTQREVEDSVASVTAEIAQQTQAIDANTAAAQRAKAAQSFFNAKAAPGLLRGSLTRDDKEEIASVLRVAEARDIEIQKLKAEEAATAELMRTQEAQRRAASLGTGNLSGKSAAESASVFKEADAAALERFESQLAATTAREREMAAAATKLRGELNPLAEIEDRLARETAEVNALFKAGKITATEQAAAIDLLRKRSQAAGDALRGASGLDSRGRPSLFGLKPYELQNLSFQINDVFTQIASGTSISQTLAQQGGQILQLFPQVGSAIAAGLSSGPVLAFTAAMGVLVLSIRDAVDQAQQLRTFGGLIEATGDTSASAAGLKVVNRELDRYGIKAEEALKITRQLFQKGIAQENIAAFGTAAKDLADVFGIDLNRAVELVTEGFTGNFEALEKLQRETHAFTPVQMEQVRALYEQGRASEGAALAFDIFSGKMRRGADEARGPWTQSFRELGNSWDNLTESLGNTAFVQDLIGALDGVRGVVEGVTWAFDQLAASKENALNSSGQPQRSTGSSSPGLLTTGLLTTFPALGALVVGGQAALASRRAAQQQQNTAAGIAPSTGPTADQVDNATRLNRELDRQETAQRRINSQADIETTLAERRRQIYLELGNTVDDNFKKTYADRVLAGERLKLEEQLAATLKQQSEERERQARDATFQSMQLLRQFEGFRSGAYWDVNAFRAGFGSDTVTREDGRVESVTRNTRVSRSDAERDLERRVGEILEGLKKTIGAARFEAFSAQQQAALASIVYNYGRLPERILEEVKQGTPADIAAAVRGLAGDNAGVNRQRRLREADILAQPNLTIDADNLRLADERLQKQGEFNRAVNEENAARIRAIRAAGELRDLEGEARLDVEKRLYVEEAVRKQREEAAKKGLVYTDDQRRATEALAAAEFEATRAVDERKRIRESDAQKAVSDSQKLISALQSQRQTLMDGITFAQDQNNFVGAEQLQEQLGAVNSALDQAIERAIAMWTAIAGDPEQLELLNMTNEEVRALILGLQNAVPPVEDLGRKFLLTGRQFNESIAQQGAQAFDRFSQAVAEGNNVFRSLRDAFLQFAADFLRQIAQMIFQQAIFNALGGANGGGGAGGGGALSSLIAGLFHDGGVVGQGGKPRAALPQWFVDAPRLHTGGVAGLRPNEMAAVLEKGEEVLTRGDPRHVLNGGAAAGGTGSVKIVNAIDAGDFVSQGLSTRGGEQAIMNFIRANKGAVKQALG